MTTLMDTVRTEAPTRAPVRPASRSRSSPAEDTDEHTHIQVATNRETDRSASREAIMLGAGMHDEAFNLQRVAVLLAPRSGRSEAFPLAQAVVGSTIVADALSRMSRLRNATTVSPP